MHLAQSRSTIDTILFDLDGTLVDTERAAAQAIDQSFAAWNVRITAEDAAFITGRTWEITSQHLKARYPLPGSVDEIRDHLVGAYRAMLATHLKEVPGAAEAVRAAAGAGYEIGLVSGSHRREILFALDRLGIRQHFKVILGAEDYPRSKPAPDGYLKALEILGGRDPKRTLIFEDSQAGIESALAAGCWVVAITATNHFNQDNTRAHLRIEDLRQVNEPWIQSMSARLARP